MSEAPASRDDLLVRGVGRWSLVALLVNLVIGAGVLGLPSKAFAQIGVNSFYALGAAGLLMAAIALCFAELGGRFTGTGGPYLYVRDAFGETAGYAAGWLTWVTRPLSAATLLNLLIAYLAGFIPEAGTEPWRSLIILGLVGGLTAIIVAGIRQSAWFSNALAIGKLILLIGVALAGLAFIGQGTLPAPIAVAPGRFMETVLLLFFAFVGFESICIVAGEVKDPKRSYPFAILAGMALITAIYGALIFACIMLLPDLAASERPVADLAQRIGGVAGYRVVGWGALIVLLSSVTATFILAPRILMSAAERGQAPALLGAVHPRWRTPHWAIIATAAVTLVVTVFNDFITALTFTTLTRLLIHMACCAAVLRLRQRDGAESGGFVVPGGPAIPVLAVLAAGGLIVFGAWKSLPQLAAIIAAGFVLLWLTQLWERRKR